MKTFCFLTILLTTVVCVTHPAYAIPNNTVTNQSNNTGTCSPTFKSNVTDGVCVNTADLQQKCRGQRIALTDDCPDDQFCCYLSPSHLQNSSRDCKPKNSNADKGICVSRKLSKIRCTNQTSEASECMSSEVCCFTEPIMDRGGQDSGALDPDDWLELSQERDQQLRLNQFNKSFDNLGQVVDDDDDDDDSSNYFSRRKVQFGKLGNSSAGALRTVKFHGSGLIADSHGLQPGKLLNSTNRTNSSSSGFAISLPSQNSNSSFGKSSAGGLRQVKFPGNGSVADGHGFHPGKLGNSSKGKSISGSGFASSLPLRNNSGSFGNSTNQNSRIVGGGIIRSSLNPTNSSDDQEDEELSSNVVITDPDDDSASSQSQLTNTGNAANQGRSFGYGGLGFNSVQDYGQNGGGQGWGQSNGNGWGINIDFPQPPSPPDFQMLVPRPPGPPGPPGFPSINFGPPPRPPRVPMFSMNAPEPPPFPQPPQMNYGWGSGGQGWGSGGQNSY